MKSINLALGRDEWRVPAEKVMTFKSQCAEFLRQLNESYYLKKDFAALRQEKRELSFLEGKYGCRFQRNVYTLPTKLS
jgi:hypothetical protein